MTQTPYPWENPQQDYKVTLAKRRSERRYRSLQLAKTLEILLTKFKKYIDDGDFSSAKKFVAKMKRELKKLEK